MEFLDTYDRYGGKCHYTNDFDLIEQGVIETEIIGVISDIRRHPEVLTRATMVVFFVSNFFYSTISGATLVSAIDLVFKIRAYIDVYIEPAIQTKESYERHSEILLLAIISVLRPDLVIVQL
jgi:hypothetical protein